MLMSLQACQSRDDFAKLLGYKPSSLAYILYQIDDANKYSLFSIKKKDGSDREIAAPVARLKALQSKLADLLYESIADIQEANPRHFSSIAGYSKGIGIYDNTKRHCGRKFVFNIDLEDFFPSIHIGRIIGFFLKDKQFSLHKSVATTIGQIACHESKLPQGSPCSPVISNLVGSLLDARLARFAAAHSCRYSRYADDITFSTNRKDFPTEIAKLSDDVAGWSVSDDLESRIVSAGYKINSKKTRMSVKASRQTVTGLVANRFPNVSEEYYKRTRSMCHRAFDGVAVYKHHFFDDDPKTSQVAASGSYLEGRLSHIYAIKVKSERRSFKEIQDEPRNYFKLYRDFLIFRTFYQSKRPLIITEGESDRIYLKLSARALFDTSSPFLHDEDGETKLSFRTQRYTKRLAEVLGLAGGTGNLIKTLVHLKDFSRAHPSLVPTSPVVIMIDNDSGSKPLFKPIKQLFGVSLSAHNAEEFVRLKKGLYLIRTPSLPTQMETFIESFLHPSVLSQEVNGKSFNSETTFDTSGHFGKVRLAQIVAASKPAVDMSGFKPLMDRVAAAWGDWDVSGP